MFINKLEYSSILPKKISFTGLNFDSVRMDLFLIPELSIYIFS